MKFWDSVMSHTYAKNSDQLDELIATGDGAELKAKFKVMYLETARVWLKMLFDF